MLLIYINTDVGSSSTSAVKSTQTKEDELWEEHDTDGRGEKRINKFSQNAWREETIGDFVLNAAFATTTATKRA
jgi:hypothetical protein